MSAVLKRGFPMGRNIKKVSLATPDEEISTSPRYLRYILKESMTGIPLMYAPTVVRDLGSFGSDTVVNLEFNEYPGAASPSLSDGSPLFSAVQKFHRPTK